MQFITDIKTLKEKLENIQIFLEEKEIEEIKAVIKKYPMRINSSYFSLIKEKNDPIWNQCIPRIEEIQDNTGEEDPLHEENTIPSLTHRYKDRCLLIISNTCATYCRFCTRKRKVGEINKNPTIENIKKAIKYIEEHKEIRDVVISGGDPLLLTDKRIEEILVELRKIPHIEIIRIGTRVPCVMPERITDELCLMLKKYNKRPILYINTHFEHPSEITPQVQMACEKLIDSGIQLGNQSIILKNVNDKIGTFKILNQKLLSIGIKPYYLYQPDLVRGTAHFRGPVENGLRVIKELRGHTSGMAVPHFVVDSPGGKIPLIPKYTTILNNGDLEMENYEGKKFHYPHQK